MDFSTSLTILLPIFSGLTFLAYKHPQGYERLFKTASKWAYPITVITLGYLAGKQDGAKSFEFVAAPEIAAQAKATLKDVDHSFDVLFFYVGGSWLYLAILTYLPEFTRETKAGDGSKTKDNPASIKQEE